MQETFKITQDITVFEFWKGVVYVFIKSKKLIQVIFIGPAVILMLGIIYVILSSNPWNAAISTIGQLLVLLIFLVCFFAAGFFLLTIMMRLLRPGHFKNTVYEFNNWGMHKKAGDAEYTRPWKGFAKWQETKSFFLLYIAKNDAHIICKKYFSESELISFRSFLENHIGIS